MKILMVAAENGALPGGKVGGMGDVIRDVPGAIEALGHDVDIVTPGYQHFSRLPTAKFQASLKVVFSGREECLELFLIDSEACGLHWVIEHPAFAPFEPGRIYNDDPPQRPFATDATKFAFFSKAVAQAIHEKHLQPEVIHLHDWHAAFVAILIKNDPAYLGLADIPLVFTIHNLALQGIRPLRGDASSLSTWFPSLEYSLVEICDPRYAGCVNPMRAGINLCDKIHVVSPRYAREIQRANDEQLGLHGGEGLEVDLQRAAKAGRLHGILNGCEYENTTSTEKTFSDLLELATLESERWLASNDSADSSGVLALRKLDRWRQGGKERPDFLLTSVGRMTAQKVQLLRESVADGRTVLEHLLDRMMEGGVLIMLGSGDKELESFFTLHAAQHENFLFLKGFSEPLSRTLYSCGDLFLMPSSFEPCGISQMLAMREGQPCLAHKTGGLADTIADGENGFLFEGKCTAEQAENLVQRFDEVLMLRSERPQRWKKIKTRAKAARFLWADAARDYLELLYTQRGK